MGVMMSESSNLLFAFVLSFFPLVFLFFCFVLVVIRSTQKNECKFVNIFLSIKYNTGCGCSKEPSH